MEVFTTEKPTSWPQRLMELDVGEKILADFSKKNTVRDAANKVFLREDRKFSTKKKVVQDRKFLEIKRVK